LPDAYISTSTSIRWASMPYTAALRVLKRAILDRTETAV
jgi:hypothetical protein